MDTIDQMKRQTYKGLKRQRDMEGRTSNCSEYHCSLSPNHQPEFGKWKYLDDQRKEDTKSLRWNAGKDVEDQDIPELPILQRFDDILSCDLRFLGERGVDLHSSRRIQSLLLRQELCGARASGKDQET